MLGSMPVAASVSFGAGTADAVDVGEGDLHALFAREVDAYEASHSMVLLLGVEGLLAAPVRRPLPADRSPAFVRRWRPAGVGAVERRDPRRGRVRSLRTASVVVLLSSRRPTTAR